MARFYIIQGGADQDDPLHVHTEMLGALSVPGDELTTDQQRQFIFETRGENLRVLTEGELRMLDGGLRALEDWRAGDESAATAAQDQMMWVDQKADLRMLAERRGDPRAQKLIQRGYPKVEVREYLRAEAQEGPP